MPSPSRPAPTGHGAGGRRDVGEFEALFRAHYGPLCDFVHGYVRSREVARELVQDLFLRLWERTETPGSTLAAAYLYIAARNRALRHLRRQRVAARWLELVAPESSTAAAITEEAVHEHELSEALERAVAELPERCRLVFTLSRHRHLSNADIARALGISVNTVEQQMWRALKALRARLAPYLDAAVKVPPA
jgi:RNA polymerase sigma-70 factor (ECF subfamily)